jgi:hypothetical protein
VFHVSFRVIGIIDERTVFSLARSRGEGYIFHDLLRLWKEQYYFQMAEEITNLWGNLSLNERGG